MKEYPLSIEVKKFVPTIDKLVDIISKNSFEIIPGKNFNNFYASLIEKRGDSPYPIVYEMFLPPEQGWLYMKEKIYPPFIRYLENKRMDIYSPTQVIVALFFSEKCYLLYGDNFIRIFIQIEGLTQEEYKKLALTWLSGTS